MKWSTSAPANIALIKYMGKLDEHKNIPLNGSLSFTLDHCRTFVDVEINSRAIDEWQPLNRQNSYPLQLSETAQHRFLKHVKLLKHFFQCDTHFLIKSCNDFPADCGLASSASSYAALTKAICMAITDIKQLNELSLIEMAQLSQMGSGSSCRSFFSAWCLWQENNVQSIKLPFEKLLHQVVVINKEKKSISSSEAHKIVQTSSLYPYRKQRSEERLSALIQALADKNWSQSFAICWQEFWDMHALFETSAIPFGYMTDLSIKVIDTTRKLWKKLGDGPIVTMDAGPNVHLLYREDQFDIAKSLQTIFEKNFTLIKNYE